MKARRGDDSIGYECMDNFALDVRATTRRSFDHAIAIALAHSPSGKVTHWVEDSKYGLVLFWSGSDEEFKGKKIQQFPFEMKAKDVASFAWRWLQKVDRIKFQQLKGMDAEYDDGDVDNEEAWRVFVEDWGHVGSSFYAVAAVLPVWAWLGK